MKIIIAITLSPFVIHNDFHILFSEMAERHNVPQVMMMARDLVHKVQTLIENKWCTILLLHSHNSLS